MKRASLRITAFDDHFWTTWPPLEFSVGGSPSRRLISGRSQTVTLPTVGATSCLAVICLADSPKRKVAKHWKAFLDGHPVSLDSRDSFPNYLLIQLPHLADVNEATLTFKPTKATHADCDLLIEELVIMPLAGRFSEFWTSPLRALKKLLLRKHLAWAPADFPYSHFDGLGYLLDYDEVRQAVLSRKCDTAFRYWYGKGRRLGHPLPLALEREPLPGTPFNLVMHFQEAALSAPFSAQSSGSSYDHAEEIVALRQENELLHLQLRETQEELEKYFLKTFEWEKDSSGLGNKEPHRPGSSDASEL